MLSCFVRPSQSPQLWILYLVRQTMSTWNFQLYPHLSAHFSISVAPPSLLYHLWTFLVLVIASVAEGSRLVSTQATALLSKKMIMISFVLLNVLTHLFANILI